MKDRTNVILERFYERLVATLRERGVVCAITSGMACVHYGVAESGLVPEPAMSWLPDVTIYFKWLDP